MRNVFRRAFLWHLCGHLRENSTRTWRTLVLPAALTLTLSGCIQTGVIGSAGISEEGSFTGISSATVLSPSTVKIVWQISSQYSDYKIFSSTSSTPISTTIFSTYTVTGLAPNTEFLFSVGGTSRSTGFLEAVNKTLAVQTWPAFTGLSTLTAPDATTLRATWNYPVQGPTYRVYVKAGSAFTANDPALITPVASTSGGTIDIKQLANGAAITPYTTYYALVRAAYLDDTVESNGTVLSVTTPSNINPLPTITTDANILGRWPAITVSGAGSEYVTSFTRNGVLLGRITGNGTFRLPTATPLGVGANTIDASVSYQGSSVDLPSFTINSRELGSTMTQAPAFKAHPITGAARGYQRLGYSSTTGDFNCDGYQDLALGAPSTMSQSLVAMGSDGAVYVYYGSATGLNTSVTPSIAPTGTNPLLLLRPRTSSAGASGVNFGLALAAGNINADRNGAGATDPECDDLIIGTHSTGSSGGQGEVWVFFGSTTGLQQGQYVNNTAACSGSVCSPLLITPPSGSWRATSNNEGQLRFGTSVAVGRMHAPAGGDRYRDIVIGVPGDASGPGTGAAAGMGAAWIYYGSNQGVNFTRVQDTTGFWDLASRPFTRIYLREYSASASTQWLNNASVAAVNLDGDTDNIDDLVIGVASITNGTYARQGGLYYFSSKTYVGNPPAQGATYSNTTAQTGAFIGNPVWPQLTYIWNGGTLANVGDINNDGYPDLAISAGQRYQYESINMLASDVEIIYGSSAGPQTGSCKTNRSTVGTGSTCTTGQNTSCTAGVCSRYYISRTPSGATPSIHNGLTNSIATFASNTLNLNKILNTGDTNNVNDINGDGYSDILVGYPSTISLNAKALLYYGSANGLAPTPTAVDPLTKDAFSNLGLSVAIGDFNGDQKADVVANEPDNNTMNGAFGGVGYVFNGSATGLSSAYVTEADLILAPNLSKENYTYQPKPAGDINGDGYDDVIVRFGHLRWNISTQNDANLTDYDAIIYFGSANGLITTPLPSTTPLNLTDPMLLSSLTASGLNGNYSMAEPAGDMNGDGFDDVIAFSSSTTDTYFYFGSSSGLQTAVAPAVPPIVGLNPVVVSQGDNVSLYVNLGAHQNVTYGDFNGDNYSDIAFSVIDGNYVLQKVAIIYGSASGPQTDGTLTRPNFTTHAPSAFGKFLEPCNGAIPQVCTAQWLEDPSNGRFAYSLAALGDVDGDGYEDLAVSNIITTVSGYAWNGSIFVYFGGPKGLETWNGSYRGMEIQPQVNPMQSSRYCGVSLGYAGDINKDSYNDMIVSCYNDYRGGVQNGSAMIFYGCKSNRHTAAAPEPGCSLRGFYGVADPLDAVPANRITAMPLLNSSTSCVQGGACQPMVIYPKAVSTITGGTNMYWGRNVGSPGDINGDGYSDIFIGAYEFQLPCTTAACPATPLTIAGAAVLYTGSPTGLNAAPNVTYYPLCENGVCTPYYIRPSMSGWGTTSTAACYFSYNTVFNQPRSYDYNNDGLADFLIYSAFYANPSSDPRQSTVVSGGFFTFQ